MTAKADEPVQELARKNCHDCTYLYSCGYTGCLGGCYECSQKHLFKRANSKFWSLKEQKIVNEETAKQHWLEHGESIVTDEREGNK